MTNERSEKCRGADAPYESVSRVGARLCNLQCKVPVEARRRARIAAIKSGLPFRVYVAQLLLQAKPVRTEQADASDAGQAVPGEALMPAEAALEPVSDGDAGPVPVGNGDDAKDDAAMAAEQDAVHEERSER